MIMCMYLTKSKKWKIEERENTFASSDSIVGFYDHEEMYGFMCNDSDVEMQMYFDGMRKKQISDKLAEITKATKELAQINRLNLQDVYKAHRKKIKQDQESRK